MSDKCGTCGYSPCDGTPRKHSCGACSGEECCHGHAEPQPPADAPTCKTCGAAGKLYERPAESRWVHAVSANGRHHDFVTDSPTAQPAPTSVDTAAERDEIVTARRGRVMYHDFCYGVRHHGRVFQFFIMPDDSPARWCLLDEAERLLGIGGHDEHE